MKTGKKVYQFDLDGNLIKEWVSIREASNVTGIEIYNIHRGLKHSTAGGFIWDRSNTTTKRPDTPMVYQFTRDGDFVKSYRSATVAAKELGISNCNISGSIKHRKLTVGGFIWESAPTTERRKVSNKGISKPRVKRTHVKNVNKSNQQNVKIYQFAKDGTFIKEWNSIKEASTVLCVNQGNICRSAQHHLYSVGGCLWEYTPTTTRGNLGIKLGRKPTNQYWTSIQEQLVIDYNLATTQLERSMIYNKLRHAILIMISSILRKYFKNFLSNVDQDELINECEVKLIEKTISSFDPSRGKAYSFIGTSAKNFYSAFFLSKSKTKDQLEDIELHYDNPVFSIEDSYSGDLLNDVKTKARKHLQRLLLDYREFNLETTVIKAVLLLIEESDYGKDYSTYFLLRETKLKPHRLYYFLCMMGLGSLMRETTSISIYDQVFKEYKTLHGANVTIKDALNNYSENLTKKSIEQRYRIEESKSKARTPCTKAKTLTETTDQNIR